MTKKVTREQILQQKARAAEAEAACVRIVKEGNISMGTGWVRWVQLPDTALRQQEEYQERTKMWGLLRHVEVTDELDDALVEEVLRQQLRDIPEYNSARAWCDRVRALGGPRISEQYLWEFETYQRRMTPRLRRGAAVFQAAFLERATAA
ncbi:hypothetical protein [Microvirga sp. G4-2]|uniref:hypothetical protein n=1 Tax=Microvirga sp. G4-2 TaxID=3434467 RepID=UPI0040442A7B